MTVITLPKRYSVQVGPWAQMVVKRCFIAFKQNFPGLKVIAIMETPERNSISGKQGSGPGFSSVRLPAPEVLSSHHAAEQCSRWQHLISSCQLQHGNLISSNQLEPGELLWGNVNSSVNLPGSYLATPLYPGSFLWVYCHSNDCQCNVVTRRAGAIAGFQKSQPLGKTAHFLKNAIF